MKKILYSFLAIVLGLVLSGAGCNQDAYDPEVFDLGVKIGSHTWATRNVDTPGTFAATPESPGMFYQWDRKVGWTITNPFGSTPTGITWGIASSATTWDAVNDPCPAGWQVPTIAQFLSLFDPSVTKEWVSSSSVDGGVYLGTAPNRIFLPSTGFRLNGSSAPTFYSNVVQYRVSQNSYAIRVVDFGDVLPLHIDSAESDPLTAYSVRCVKK